MIKGNNTPHGFDDPANEERLYEPDLKEWRELVWKFMKYKQNEFIDYIESQAGECNKEMILAWVECDYKENT